MTDATILTASHDNTRKKGRVLAGAQITVGDVSNRTHRVYSLGVEEVADGTAVSSLDSFMRRLESLLRSARVSNLNDELRSALLQIQACLSDRCPAELKWNRLLQERKFELVQQHYASLPFDAQVDMARVYSFFCLAHALS